jgi:hypothetical protein
MMNDKALFGDFADDVETERFEFTALAQAGIEVVDDEGQSHAKR